jgi:predicted GIY-YIG superfamily endonuclease
MEEISRSKKIKHWNARRKEQLLEEKKAGFLLERK